MTPVRPVAFTIGVVLLVLSSLVNIVGAFIQTGDQGPPAFIIWSGVVLGIIGLLAAVGLWQRRRWALWLAVVVLVLGILSTAPGIVFPPLLALRSASLVSVIVSVITIVLLLLPRSREALTA